MAQPYSNQLALEALDNITKDLRAKLADPSLPCQHKDLQNLIWNFANPFRRNAETNTCSLWLRVTDDTRKHAAQRLRELVASTCRGMSLFSHAPHSWVPRGRRGAASEQQHGYGGRCLERRRIEYASG